MAASSPTPSYPSSSESLSPQKYILLLGEGNFSFASSLSDAFRPATSSGYISDDSGFINQSNADSSCGESEDNNSPQKFKLIATDLNEELLTLKPLKTNHKSEQIRENISNVRENGGIVLLDVDATRLQHHSKLNHFAPHISQIIFNYPHAKSKKMKIGLNRDLLKKFFLSAAIFLRNSGQLVEEAEVHVTLCSGQSGVDEVETKKRLWKDSWQMLEMAATGGFILKKAQPFQKFVKKLSSSEDSQESEEITNFKIGRRAYESAGFRNGHGSFRSENSNTFTLSYRDPPKFFCINEELEKMGNTAQELRRGRGRDEIKLFSSLDEQLILKMDSLAEILYSVHESHPLRAFVTNLFQDASFNTNCRLRPSFPLENPTSEFGFFSGIELWIEGVRDKDMMSKIMTHFFPMENKNLKLKSSEIFAMEKEDDLLPALPDIATSRSVRTKKGIKIATVHYFGSTNFEHWDLNLTALLLLRNQNCKPKQDTDWRSAVSEYCRWTVDPSPSPANSVSDFLQGNFSTGSLYPRTLSWDCSFWSSVHSCSNSKDDAANDPSLDVGPLPALVQTVRKIAVLVYGPLLKSIQFMEKYPFPKDKKQEEQRCCKCHEEFKRVSYLFRLRIQSLDRPLNPAVAECFQRKFREGLLEFLNQVELR